MDDCENRYDLDDTETHAPEDEYSEEAVLERFNEESLVTKQDVLDRIDYEWRTWEHERTTDQKHSEVFYSILLSLMNRFRKTITLRKLFMELEPFWCYSIHIESTGASLMLEHCAYVRIDEEGRLDASYVDESYELIKVPSRLLLVDEYAEIYGVEPNTVRMWIRRGKIRTAIKYGREWRIPELTDTPERGYRFGQYSWQTPLTDLPEEFSYLNEYDIISFEQDAEDKNKYKVTLMSGSKPYRHIILSQKERERLELYLISNPMVQYGGTFGGDGGSTENYQCIGSVGRHSGRSSGLGRNGKSHPRHAAAGA